MQRMRLISLPLLFSSEYLLRMGIVITLYADCSALGIEIGEHIDQTSKQAENKKRSAPPSNEVSGKTCKRTANDKRTALTTLISDALLPGEESNF